MSPRRVFLTTTAVIASGVIGFFAGRLDPNTPVASKPSPAAGSSSSGRPLIGIASLSDPSYIRAVREHGGIPVVLPNTDGSIDRIDDYLEELDGLLLPGGLDIPPSEYGEEPHPTILVLSKERYQFEKHLIKKWIEESDKPLLGICLGSQWMNVVCGGTLIQDIPSEKGGNHRGVTHQVTIEPDSRLGRIFGSPGFEVNSNHHQAVGTLGQELRIVATSPDGIVEATESTDKNRFLVGVQWHPERLIERDPGQGKLFEAFIEAAQTYAASN